MGRTRVKITEEFLKARLSLPDTAKIMDCAHVVDSTGRFAELTLEGPSIPDSDECELIYMLVPEHVKIRFEKK